MLQDFCTVVTSRRSVRIFDKTPIPAHVMEKCLDLALLAPNSSNLQAWEFYWVRSQDKKQQLVEACLSQPAAVHAAELVVCVAKTNTWRQNIKRMISILEKSSGPTQKAALKYYSKILPAVYRQGFLNFFGFFKKVSFFFLGFFKPVVREPTSHSEMVLWASKSCSLAAQNLMLALKAHEFDSCPMEGFDSSRVKKILNLRGKHSYIVMVIAAGKGVPNGTYGPRIRFERSLFVKEV